VGCLSVVADHPRRSIQAGQVDLDTPSSRHSTQKDCGMRPRDRALVRDEETGWLFSGRCLRVRPNPLGTLDDKSEPNRKMSETLEEMARTLFKAWFVDVEPARQM